MENTTIWIIALIVVILIWIILANAKSTDEEVPAVNVYSPKTPGKVKTLQQIQAN